MIAYRSGMIVFCLIRWMSLTCSLISSSNIPASQQFQENEVVIAPNIHNRVAGSEKWIWPNGIVPYEFAADMAPSVKRLVENEVMPYFHAQTCIRFVPWTNEKYSVFFKSDSSKSCFSMMGWFNMRKQVVNLHDTTFCGRSKRSIMHELMHVLGFIHEHQRPDRDQFIEVVEPAIKPKSFSDTSNWTWTWKKALTTHEGVEMPYCYSSVMHYAIGKYGNDYSIKLNPAARAQLAAEGLKEKHVGNLPELAPCDLLRVRTMYKCPGPYNTPAITVNKLIEMMPPPLVKLPAPLPKPLTQLPKPVTYTPIPPAPVAPKPAIAIPPPPPPAPKPALPLPIWTTPRRHPNPAVWRPPSTQAGYRQSLNELIQTRSAYLRSKTRRWA